MSIYTTKEEDSDEEDYYKEKDVLDEDLKFHFTKEMKEEMRNLTMVQMKVISMRRNRMMLRKPELKGSNKGRCLSREKSGA